jgi:hypothetical protein
VPVGARAGIVGAMTGRNGALAAVAGRALAAVTGAIMLVRRPRPIHSRGVVLSGSVRWLAGPRRRAAGIRWIDTPPSGGTQRVTARVSRGVGLPPQLPDIIGLALRFETPAGPADVELSSTGFDVPGRYMLLPHRSASSPWYSTLLPYRGSLGPVQLAARTRRPLDLPPIDSDLAERLTGEDWLLDLYWADARSRWRRFAELRLSAIERPPAVVDVSPATEVSGQALRFDAVLRPLPAGAQRGRIAHSSDSKTSRTALFVSGPLTPERDSRSPLRPPAPTASSAAK